MAKWGEGDPRWLVAERDDGKNINGWHWEEKNKMGWTKQRLSELLPGLSVPVPGDQGAVKVVTVKEVTGEASMTTRKGNKKFAVFDLKITLSWEGELTSGKKIQGEIKVEEFASAGDADDYIFTTTVTGSGSEQDICKKAAESLKPQLLTALDKYVMELNELQ